MIRALIPCPHCSAHVRAREVRCPFCDGDLGRTRLGRMASLAGSSLLTLSLLGASGTAVACYGAPPPMPEPEADASETGVQNGQVDEAPAVDGAVGEEE